MAASRATSFSGRLRMAAARGADGAREQRHRFGIGKFAVGRVGQRGGLAPLAALNRVARRDCRAGIYGGEVAAGQAARFLHHGLGVRVARQLQVRVDHVVHGVQCLTDAVVRLRRGHGADVGVDRFPPQTDAGEDVRGHVQRVSGARRDVGVAQRGRQSLLRDRRIVIAVNEIMGSARMVRMLGELRLENRGRL